MKPAVRSALVLLALLVSAPAGLSTEAPPAPSDDAAAALPEWSSDLAAALAAAPDREPRPVVLLFTASWCGPCQRLKQKFNSPAFADAFKGFRFVMIDIDSEQGKKLKSEWNATHGIPDVRFISEQGAEIGGFGGDCSLEEVKSQLAKAREWEARDAGLRTAAAGAPANPVVQLQFAEHLLLLPSQRGAIDLLKKVAALDAGNRAGCAARANWLITGALVHPFGVASDEVLREVADRLRAFEAFTSRRNGADTYRRCVEMWQLYAADVRRQIDERTKAKDPDRRLTFADDSPVLAAIRELQATAPDGASGDCIGDALLLSGMLCMRRDDHDAGIRTFGEFTERYPSHRWLEQGQRGFVICQRMKQEAEQRRKQEGEKDSEQEGEKKAADEPPSATGATNAAGRTDEFGDTDAITSLTPEQARKLAAEFAGVEVTFRVVRGLSFTAKDALSLNGLKSLNAEMARVLATGGRGALVLNGLTAIDAETAGALAEVKGDRPMCLSLDGLTTLDADTAKALAASKNWTGELSGITVLESPDSVAVAEALATREGPLSLPNLEKISPKTLAALIKKQEVEIPLVETLELTPEPDVSFSDDFLIPEGFKERQLRKRDAFRARQ